MILLDTHIWIRWILNDDPLPGNLLDLINTTEKLAVSSISCWEVVLLEKRQKIKLTLPIQQWLQEALEGSAVTPLPITASIAERAGLLSCHHKDPADRFIIATAIQHDIKLVSLDGKFSGYDELKQLLITGKG